MSQNKFLLNNNLENYLIHGQLLSYRYEIPNAWFVIIKYENQLVHNSERLKWFKKRCYLKNKVVFDGKRMKKGSTLIKKSNPILL
jgi:hypothetical protein